MKKSQKKQKMSRRELDLRKEMVVHAVHDMFEPVLHAKQAASLGNALEGILVAASLGIQAIGAGYALANGTNPKHASKQVDRLLSNTKISLDAIALPWFDAVLDGLQDVIVHLDWTNFDDCDHATLSLALETGHGRSTLLLSRTYKKSALKGRQNQHEVDLLTFFAHYCEQHDLRVTLVADRGFDAAEFRAFPELELQFDSVIRLRSNLLLEHSGRTQKAGEWVHGSGKARSLKDVKITGEKIPCNRVVTVRDKGMEKPWLLATSREDLKTRDVIKTYGTRFRIEESFRDLKNERFGLGLSQVKIKVARRRDMLMYLGSVGVYMLSKLGEAVQNVEGMEKRYFGCKPGQRSRMRLGADALYMLPNMVPKYFEALLEAFGQLVSSDPLFEPIIQRFFGPASK